MASIQTGQYDLLVRLSKGGSPTPEKTSPAHSDAEYHNARFGDSGDLWSTTWTAAELDAMHVHVRADLGDTTSGNFAIDAMIVTVFYIDPSGVKGSKSITVGIVGLGL